MSEPTLILGNKAYSSWSLRAWLALKQTGVPFREVVIPLRRPETSAEIHRYSPSGKVPVLRHQGLTVWESLAIGEYIAETWPEARLWPEDREARAYARAIASEMHAGFAELRRALPMNLKERRPTPELSAAVQADIARIEQIWQQARSRFARGAPYLFGHFTLADAMYAPVCTRFATYGVPLAPDSQDYVAAILELPAMQDWYAAARAEPWEVASFRV